MLVYSRLMARVAVIVGIAAWGEIGWTQEPQLAPEGRGLLPRPAEIPATLNSIRPENPFVRDPSGEFSRTIFETDEDPNLKLVIRDFSFPPDRYTHTITLPSGAFLHILGGEGE